MSLEPFKGCSVLFFCPKVFGYDDAIRRELEAMGSSVTYHSDRPVEHAWVKAVIRIFPTLGVRLANRHFLSWLDANGPRRCDVIFIVKGEAMSPRVLRALKARYPDAHVVLYLWDSLENYPQLRRLFEFANDIFSFDPIDCAAETALKYEPLFFRMEHLQGTLAETAGRQVFFLGTLNGDRPAVLDRMLKSGCVDLDYWLFVRSRLELALRYVRDGALRRLSRERLLFRPMSAEAIRERVSRSFAVLDVEHERQAGLTMRSFETLASGQKLITTNPRIREHEFFDPDRILVLDRSNPTISEEFVAARPRPLPSSFFSEYSLRGWIGRVFRGFFKQASGRRDGYGSSAGADAAVARRPDAGNNESPSGRE